MTGLKIVGYATLLTLCVMAAMLWFCRWIERVAEVAK